MRNKLRMIEKGKSEDWKEEKNENWREKKEKRQ